MCVLHALSGSARTWITVVNERAVARSQRLGELHKQQQLLLQQQQQQQEEEQQEVPQQQEPVQSLQEVLVQEPSRCKSPDLGSSFLYLCTSRCWTTCCCWRTGC